jgi:hypothetical protein
MSSALAASHAALRLRSSKRPLGFGLAGPPRGQTVEDHLDGRPTPGVRAHLLARQAHLARKLGHLRPGIAHTAGCLHEVAGPRMTSLPGVPRMVACSSSKVARLRQASGGTCADAEGTKTNAAASAPSAT